MKTNVIVILSAMCAATAALAVAASNPEEGIEMAFASHIEVGMAEQDVMIEKGDGMIYRFGANEAEADTPLFAAAIPVSHNPFDETANGPHPKGEALGLTAGEWLAAQGTAHYVEVGGVGRLTAEFDGLVPNGVYTMWHFFMSTEATEPFIGTFDMPVGNKDGSQSVFVADAQGRASFDQSFAPGLQMTGEQLAAGLAIAWHSDGKTYGVLPGDFGKTAHVQLFTSLPEEG